MKKIKTLVFTFLLLFFSANLVQAMSLDEIYRDVVRSDNRGYLPMFVKNRTAPDFLDEEVVLKDVPEPKPENPRGQTSCGAGRMAGGAGQCPCRESDAGGAAGFGAQSGAERSAGG